MQIERIEDILKEERNTQSDYHIRLGRAWRILGESHKLHAPLAYAAFEFRIAMERTLLELLFLIKNQRLSSDELSYNFGQIKKALYKTQDVDRKVKEKLQRRLEFNSIYAKHLPIQFKPSGRKIAVIDIEKISKFWGELSTYCHRQLKADNTWRNAEWVSKGYELLNKVEENAWEIMVVCQVGWVRLNEIPKEIEEEAKKFIDGKITKSSLEGRLRLIMPVLEHRELKYSRIITLKPN
jgi:hypothetical protein